MDDEIKTGEMTGEIDESITVEEDFTALEGKAVSISDDSDNKTNEEEVYEEALDIKESLDDIRQQIKDKLLNILEKGKITDADGCEIELLNDQYTEKYNELKDIANTVIPGGKGTNPESSTTNTTEVVKVNIDYDEILNAINERADWLYIDEDGQVMLNGEVVPKLKVVELEAEKIKADVGEFKNLTTENFTATNAEIENLKANKADIEYLNANYATIQNLNATNANITNLQADKANIKDLTATNAEIDNLKANKADITFLDANYATIHQLDATNANVTNLQADTANINNALINKANIVDLNATNANVANLQAVKANITDLNAAKADINVLNSNVADITTLVNGNLTSDNIQSMVITGDKFTVANGFIKNAMIDSVAANKINTGTINTNNVSIQSADGSMMISGTTQQFKDKDNKVRIQIGKDASGNFTFCLFSQDGVGVLIDENGIKSGAVPNGLIVNDMVADRANISGSKLDINSVINSINNGTTTIKGTRIQLDEQGQSLEVAFNQLKTKVETIENVSIEGDLSSVIEQVTSNTTSVNTMQGQISSLISNTTITKANGEVVQLKDEYNSTKDTVNSHTTKIGSLETNLSKVSVGQNKWLLEMFEKGVGIDAMSPITIKDVIGKVLIKALLVADSDTNNQASYGDNYLGRATTYVYLDIDYNWETTATSDDGSTIYLNGVALATLQSCAPTVITVPFKQGWNKITWVYNEGINGDGWDFNPRLTTIPQVKYMNAYPMNNVDEVGNILDGNIKTVSSKQATLEQNLDGFKQTVSNTYATQAALNTVDGKFADYSTTSQMNSAINQKANEITSTVSQTYTTKSEFNNLNVGGRNFVINSGFKGVVPNTQILPHWDCWGDVMVFGGQGNPNYDDTNTLYLQNSTTTGGGICQDIPSTKIPKNTEITISYDIGRESNVINSYVTLEFYDADLNRVDTIDVADAVGHVVRTVTTSNTDYSIMRLAITHAGSNSLDGQYLVRISNIKIEKGNRATDWSPAPEDIDSAISTVDGKFANYSTTTDMNSAINQKSDSILSTVSSTYATKSSVTDLSNNLTNNYSTTSAMNSAINQKANEITSTVSGTYTTKSDFNNLNVGGTNFIRNGRFKNCVPGSVNSVPGWNTTDGVKVWYGMGQDIYDKYGCLYFFKEVQDGNPCYLYQDISLDTIGRGVEVTLSYDAGKELNDTHMYMEYMNSNSGVLEQITLAYNPVGYNIHTFTTNTSADAKYLRIVFECGSIKGADGSFLAILGNVKLEKGNKATDWSPAPEDIDNSITAVDNKFVNYSTTQQMNSAIDQKANEINLNVSNTYATKSSVTDLNNNLSNNYSTTQQMNSAIDAKADSITQSVSKTYATRTELNNVDNKFTNYSTTSDMNSAINQKANEITNSVSSTYSTKSETNNQINNLQGQINDTNNNISNTYASKSDLQQTTNSITAKFSEAGGYNLLRNTGFKNSLNYWGIQQHNSPQNGVIEVLRSDWEWGFPDKDVNCCCIRISNQDSIEYGISQNFTTTIGKKYTVSFYYASHRMSQANMIIRYPDGNYMTNKAFNPSEKGGGNANVNNWGVFTHTFTATHNTHTLNIVVNTAQDDGCMWIAKPMIYEGELPCPYSPHPSEVYDGITQIDKDGIKVYHNNIDGDNYTHMSPTGFYLKNRGEDIFKVDSAGLYLKGNVHITNGSVPSNLLNGQISDGLIGEWIRNGATNGSNANTWLNNSSPGWNNATSIVEAGHVNWDNAKATLDNNAGKWNDISTRVSNSSTAWDNAYNRVVDWAYGSVGGTTTINGGLIQTGTILAKHIAAGAITANEISIADLSALNATIGGFNMYSGKLVGNGGNGVGMSGNGADWAFWAGSTTGGDAPFHVGHEGHLYATNATISGDIAGSTISGSIFKSGTEYNPNKLNITGLKIEDDIIRSYGTKNNGIYAVTKVSGGTITIGEGADGAGLGWNSHISSSDISLFKQGSSGYFYVGATEAQGSGYSTTTTTIDTNTINIGSKDRTTAFKVDYNDHCEFGNNYFTRGSLTINKLSKGVAKGTQTYLTGGTISTTTIYQNGSSVSGSDIILKDNIKEYEDSALDIINKTKVYSFNRILANPDKTEIGFLAQQVPDIFVFDKGEFTAEELDGLTAEDKKALLAKKTEDYKAVLENRKLDEISNKVASFYDLDDEQTEEQIEQIMDEYHNVEYEVPISTINQNNIIAIMFKAIQELSQKVKELEKRL